MQSQHSDMRGARPVCVRCIEPTEWSTVVPIYKQMKAEAITLRFTRLIVEHHEQAIALVRLSRNLQRRRWWRRWRRILKPQIYRPFLPVRLARLATMFQAVHRRERLRKTMVHLVVIRLAVHPAVQHLLLWTNEDLCDRKPRVLPPQCPTPRS